MQYISNIEEAKDSEVFSSVGSKVLRSMAIIRERGLEGVDGKQSLKVVHVTIEL
jgi:hypothetical protein